jgi:hypothetical protein
MLCYIYDCNYIKVVPMKSRSASEWVKAYDSIHQELTIKGFKPKLQTLDNEASIALKNFFTAQNIDYQLVPPHCHRHNSAERAIRTFKEHFMAGLYSVDPSFPMHLWDILLPNHFKSPAYFLSSSTTLCRRALPWASGLQQGSLCTTGMQNHLTQKTRQEANLGSPRTTFTWSRHASLPVSNVYISTTASDRIVDTLKFFPHNYQMPQLSSTDRLLMAAKDMTNAFQNPHPDVPFASVGDDTITALADLAAIFKLKLQHTPSPATRASPAKVSPRPSLIPSPNQILNSPIYSRRQTRSQTTIHTQNIPDVPLPPRVVTPRSLCAS